jgi:hypothetical protein
MVFVTVCDGPIWMTGRKSGEAQALVITQHQASSAGAEQRSAKLLQTDPVVIHNTDIVAHRVAKAQVAPGDHDRLPIAY